MIKKIIINNIAIIDFLEFELSNRLNIVTGETGSGKSIIIKSIQYLKGTKFNKDDLRKGAESASIEALVSIKNKDMHLKRKISKNFVSSFYIDNNKRTFDEYSKIVSNNIDIHLNLELNLNCKVEKIILKNKNHNFETFSPDELNVKNFKVVKINSIIPETLSINGLSEFLFNNNNFDVKIVNKEIV